MASARVGGVVPLLVLVLFQPARHGYAQLLGPEFTKGELQCQNGRSAAVWKLVDGRVKCLLRCYKGLRAGRYPATDCQAPAFGGETADCLRTPPTGAEPRAVAAIERACRTDCPECYAGGDCPAAAGQAVAAAATSTDLLLLPLLFCGDQVAVSPGAFRCEQAAAKQAVKLLGALTRCTARCKVAESQGKIPPGRCAPPIQDPATTDCYGTAQRKAIAKIDAACSVEKPACYFPQPGLLIAGFITATLDGNHPGTYCGS